MKKIFLIFGLILTLTACSHLQRKEDSLESTSSVPSKPIITRTEFSDIVVPAELSVVEEKSLIVKTASFTGGVLVLRGRVLVPSLIEFFSRELPKRGWQLVGTIRYKNTLLAFTRPNQTCFIYISEPGLGMMTEVKIWASETVPEHIEQSF
ncbi:lipoprotein [Thermosulfuriphilus sp.]